MIFLHTYSVGQCGHHRLPKAVYCVCDVLTLCGIGLSLKFGQVESLWLHKWKLKPENYLLYDVVIQ